MTGRNLDWIGVNENGAELVTQSSRCVKDANATTQVCTDGRVDWRVVSFPSVQVDTAHFSRGVAPIVFPQRVTGAALRADVDDAPAEVLTLSERARRARIAATPSVRKRVLRNLSKGTNR